MITGRVAAWDVIEGWGVIESADTPGGCFGHYSNIETEGSGFRSLEVGESVEFEWEQPGYKQDGYDYRATRIRSM
ncbi:cold shock domain-containing protein [Rhodococcus sp. ABRD24]|uniref:cold-shock protein n=1 Tax=Rhodococcus sp. ABRD24 TaxID=2507582 RepID=UPI00103DF6CA|nr:cold shock domain-containing protein [Rhodococcus sp. ABRD24]QBJ98782.1 cold shock domain-containing protein [Rhodococcus sp. ABRD24]